MWLGEDGEELERKNIKVEKLDCHKIHKSVDMVAAVSNCMGGDQLTGFVSTLEVVLCKVSIVLAGCSVHGRTLAQNISKFAQKFQICMCKQGKSIFSY